MWTLSQHGNYTLRTAYHMYMARFRDHADHHVQGSWDIIWKRSIPQKVRVFLWKACRSCLPTRMRLHDKGVQCPSTCVLCSHELEEAWHLFFTCKSNIPCCQQSGLWQYIDPLLETAESFPELFFSDISNLNEHRQENVAMLLWRIWKRRNNKL